MEEHTINTLNKILDGESIHLTKSETDEVSELLPKLKNLGILQQPRRFEYAISANSRKKISKLIELKSWSYFLNWLDGQNTDSNIFNNDFSNSTIGQFNQSENLSVLKTEIKQVIQPNVKEKQQNAIISFVEKFWWQILVPLAIVIIGILIERGVINIRF